MAITLTHLQKKFGNTTVLDDVSATIQDGEFFVLVGPSGSGKSTLLRMLAGLTSVTGGKIEMDGRDVTELAPKDRHLAMVFQNYALLPFMTVAENVAFGLANLQLTAEQKAAQVKEALALVHLTELADRLPKALSGGQQQRVALARALATKAQTILMDEPLSNLDAQLRAEMRSEITRLHHEIGMTLIYVTHDQVEAMTMGDRIMVLNDHAVQQVGTPLALYNQPVNEFVAQFIGTPQMNLVPVTVAADQATFSFAGSNQTYALPAPLPQGDYRLGLRPEVLTPVAAAGPDTMTVVVDEVQQLGHATLIFGHNGSVNWCCEVNGQLPLHLGESLVLRLPQQPADWHWFKAAAREKVVS